MTNWASERGFATARFDFRSSVGFGDGGVDDVVAVSRALLDRAGPQTKLILVRGWINTGGGTAQFLFYHTRFRGSTFQHGTS